MSLDDDDNQQEEAIQADMDERAEVGPLGTMSDQPEPSLNQQFSEWESEFEEDLLAETYKLEAQAVVTPGTTTAVSGSSNELVEAENTDEQGEGPEFESRMEARTVVVHDAPPHDVLTGDDKIEAVHWSEFLVDPSSVGSNEQDDMLIRAAQLSVPLRDAVIGSLWPQGYADPNSEILPASTDADLVRRVAVTEELITHQIPNTPTWAMAIVTHITAKLACAGVITGAVGAPWIIQFLSLEDDDIALLESAKGVWPETDSIIQIYLDCIAVAKVAG